MSSDSVSVTVHILDKDYLVSCTEQEKADLEAAANYLDEKMREIRKTGKVVGADRISVMAALNISHELLQSKNRRDDQSKSMTSRIKGLQDKIEVALNKGKQMEL